MSNGDAPQKQWWRDLLTFWPAFWKYLQWWVGATAGSGFIEIIDRWKGKNVVPDWIFWVVVFIGVPIAAFLAWRERHHKVLALEWALNLENETVNLTPHEKLEAHLNHGKLLRQAMKEIKVPPGKGDDWINEARNLLRTYCHEAWVKKFDEPAAKPSAQDTLPIHAAGNDSQEGARLLQHLQEFEVAATSDKNRL